MTQADATAEQQADVSEILNPNYLEQSPFFALETFEEAERLEQAKQEPRSATEKVYSQFTDVLNAVGQKQKNSNSTLMKIYKDYQPISDSDYQMRHAAGKFDVEEKNAYSTVNKALRDETIQTMGEMITNEIGAFQAFKEGLDFSFDFKSIFGGSSAKSTAGKPRKADRVRYGLVLKDVIPPQESYAVAAMTSPEEEWQYAAKAEPVWDIEQIEKRDSRKPMQINIAASRYDLHADDRSYYYDDADMPFNLVNATTRMKTPSAKITGNVKPRNFSNAQSLSGGALPPMQFTLQQSESLYSLNYLTKANFEKEKVTHVLRAPIYKRLGFKRILNENFESVETVYENLLVTEQMPALSVHYLNQESRYLARFSHKEDNAEISFIAETPPDFNFGSDFGSKSGEKYKIDYKISF